jgi:hypothetical protein
VAGGRQRGEARVVQPGDRGRARRGTAATAGSSRGPRPGGSADGVRAGRPAAWRRDGVVVESALGAPEAVLHDGRRGADDARRGSASWPARRHRARLLLLAPATDTRKSADRRRPWRLRALLAFADPIRDGVRDALRIATAAGIQTIVDRRPPATTAAIAAEAGLGASTS